MRLWNIFLEFSMLHLKQATLSDIDTMQNLVRPEVKAGLILARNDDEMANAIRSYHVAKIEDTLVGFAALHVHTAGLAEIRSLVVGEMFRGKGYGHKIVKSTLKEAKILGIGEVLVLTYHTAFFETLGFIEIPKETLPEQKIWADCIQCKHFPVCNEVSLIKKL
jgi:amino-acid N-acetyltransferase